MTTHIHIHVKDAKSDGTISPDEDRQEEALMNRVLSDIRSWKQEAQKIGGSFRASGIKARIMSFVKANW